MCDHEIAAFLTERSSNLERPKHTKRPEHRVNPSPKHPSPKQDSNLRPTAKKIAGPVALT